VSEEAEKMTAYIAENFPETEPGFRPFGCDVLVQLRTVKEKTKGGIVLVEETKEFNNENTMVGRIIRLGPLAYRNRDSGQLWPEGVWASPGDIVLVPKWGGFRFQSTLPNGDKAKFCIFKDLEIRGGLNEFYEGLDEVL
jgi:co-chaperonin GroES (HSP10)